MSPYNYSEDYISKYGTYNVDEIGTTESVEITCLTNLEDRKFEGGVGKIFRVKCPSCKGIKTSVFGSFIYHPLSSICSSAVHAGNLEEEGGYILVEKVQGKEIYNGSVGSYDKISSTFSKSKISFKTKKAIPPTKISCTDTPAVSPFNTATVGTKFVVICPKKCSENKLFIYGTEVYSDQSPICLAGFHSGVMNDRGGEVEFIIESGQQMRKVDWLVKTQQRAKQHHTQCPLTLTLDDLNPHALYPNPVRPLGPQPLDVLYDSGASVTMFPLDHTDSSRNLRPSLHTISGCFTQDAPITDFMVGEFHAELTLDDGETVRLIFPESLAMPNTSANASLVSDTQFLLAGHAYVSDLKAPKLVFASGGEYTMNVVEAHKILPLIPLPVSTSVLLYHDPSPQPMKQAFFSR